MMTNTFSHITKVPENPSRSWDKVTFPCHGINLKTGHVVLFFKTCEGPTVKQPMNEPDKSDYPLFQYLRYWNMDYFIPAPIGTTSTFTTVD